MQVPDVRFFKQTGDVNMIPYTAMIGTGGYIAAEIFAQKSFGKPADLWSVGKLYTAFCVHTALILCHINRAVSRSIVQGHVQACVWLAAAANVSSHAVVRCTVVHSNFGKTFSL
jgi:hypothetical protein